MDKYTITLNFGAISISPMQESTETSSEMNIYSELNQRILGEVDQSTLSSLTIFRPGVKVKKLSESEKELRSQYRVPVTVVNEKGKTKTFKFKPKKHGVKH